MTYLDVVLESSDLSLSRGKRFEARRVVDGVTMQLRRGRSLAVIGPTGSGKSSLLAAFAGAGAGGLAIAGGAAHVLGVSIRHSGRNWRKIASSIGYVPQSAGTKLPAELTVAEVVAEPVLARSRRVNQRALDVTVASLLDELMLPIGSGEKFPFELSTGMRQRVALARALVEEPLVLIADEPLATMDVDVRRAASAAITRRRDEYGMATLIVTHEAEVVTELGADIRVMRAGTVVAEGAALDELLWTPGTPTAQRQNVLS